MARNYKIDFKKLAEKRSERDLNEFVELLVDYARQLEPIDFGEYESNPNRVALFNATDKIIRRVCKNANCNIESDIGENGLTGTISIKCKQFSPSDQDLFKAAVMAADSLEVEGDLNGGVDINLSFFKMLQKK